MCVCEHVGVGVRACVCVCEHVGVCCEHCAVDEWLLIANRRVCGVKCSQSM